MERSVPAVTIRRTPTSAPGGDPLAYYSAGLHIDAVCSDGSFPWGRSDSPLDSRQALLDSTLRRMSASAFWPYTRVTSAGSGFVQDCLRWRSRPSAEPPVTLPNIPVLLLGG